MNAAGGRRTIVSSDPDSAIDIRRIHRSRKRLIRAIAIAALPVFLVHRCWWPSDSIVDETLTRIGALLIGLTIAGRTWVWGHLGRRRHSGFVSDGPYSIVRHPLYAFSIIGVAGAAAQSGSIVMTLFMTGSIWLVFNRVARLEEIDMAMRFGEAYESYRRDTPGFVPDWQLWTAPYRISIEYGIMLKCLRDASLFALAIPLFIMIDWAQRMHVLPVLFRLP